MLAIQPPKNSKPKSLSANILPCRIHNDGPVDVSSRHWRPVTDEENEETSTVYFRGRKLKGRRVKMPEGYRGVVTTQCDRTVDSESTKAQNQNGARRHYDDEDENEDDNPDDSEDSTPVNVLEIQGTFSDMIVWDHEKLPESDDAFVKGVHEWIGFANAIHTDEEIQEHSATNGDGMVDVK